MPHRRALGLVALAAVTACQGLFGPKVCTSEARPSFAVSVVDAGSGESLAPAATVWVRDGTFVDTLLAGPDGIYGGVHERPGTYEVVVEHPDHVDWRETGVRVREDECHVITRQLAARLSSRP